MTKGWRTSVFAAILALLLIAGMLTGCASTPASTPAPAPTTAPAAPTAAPAAPTTAPAAPTAAPAAPTAGSKDTTPGAAPTTAAAPTKVLKIGNIMPFSGAYGFYGQAMKPSIQAYADLINEDGGVKIGSDTYKIEFIFVDDAVDPKRGPIAAQEIIDKGAVANVGCFSGAAPIASVLMPAKKIFIGQMQAGLDLKKSPYFIGGTCEWGFPLYHMYAFADAWKDVKKVGAYVYDWQNVQFSRIREEALKRPESPFVKNNIEILPVEVQTMGNQDFTTVLTKFHNAGVDTIICGFGPGDYALLAKRAGELGYKFRYQTSGTMTDLAQFIGMAGPENADGMTASWPAPWEVKKSTVRPDLVKLAQRIVQKVEKETGVPANKQYIGGFEWGINQAQMLIGFYQKAGSIDPDAAMKAAIGGEIDDFMGHWTMGGTKAWGDTARIKPDNSMLGQIKGDHFEYLGEAIMPTEW